MQGAHATRSDRDSQSACATKDNVRIGQVFEATTMCLEGLHSQEVLTPSTENLYSYSRVLTSRGMNQYAFEILDLEQFVAEETDNILLCEGNSRC